MLDILNSIKVPQMADGDFDSRAEIKKIQEYLYTLNEQLRYMLNHIDTENLSDDLAKAINAAAVDVGEVVRVVEDSTGGMRSAIEQNAEAIALKASQTAVDELGNQLATAQTEFMLTAEGLSVEVQAKTKTFSQPNAPVATAVGDLWIDTDAGNKLYRWNGTSWVSVQDAVAAAVGLATTASKLLFDATGLTVKNGGIRIQNSAGQDVLSADAAGNLALLGRIMADNGVLGAISSSPGNASVNGDLNITGNLRVGAGSTYPTSPVTPAAAGISPGQVIVTAPNANAFGTMPISTLPVMAGSTPYTLLLSGSSSPGSGGSGGGNTATLHNIVMQTYGSFQMRTGPGTGYATISGQNMEQNKWYKYVDVQNGWYRLTHECAFDGARITGMTPITNGYAGPYAAYTQIRANVPQ